MKRITSIFLAATLLLSLFCLSEVQATGKVYVRATGGSLHLRAGEGTDTDSLGFVNHGDSVQILSLGDEWSRIYVERTGLTGYIKTGYIRDIVPSATDRNHPAPSADGEYTIDLNGDGTAEKVYILPMTDEYNMEYSRLYLEMTNGSLQYYETPYYAESCSLHFETLDDSGKTYVLLSGDEASDDYSTMCFFFDGKTFVRITCMTPYPFETGITAPGAVERVKDGIVTLTGWRDLLGTWSAGYPFTLKDGMLVPVQNALWRINNDLSDSEYWKYRALVTTAQLPAVIYGQEALLPAGTSLLLTAFDPARTQAYFVTKDGACGYFNVSRSDDWGSMINGIHEEECFQALFYAG